MHDATLDRTTDGSGPVAAHPWADVAQLHVRGGGRVPRLDELLIAWDDVGWVLDAKEDVVAGPLADLVHRIARPGRRWSVGAFDGARLRLLRRLLPADVAVAAGRAEVRTLVVAARTVAWFAGPLLRQLPADVVQVPVEESGTRIVDRRFVATCHAAGLPVEVWTVNEEAEMHRLISLGVDALITDRAELALQVTAARGVARS
jgi:glycerophosphoryl diester phosphodiesterase